MVTSGFFTSIGGDRRYTNEQFSTIISTLINDGVFASVGDTFFTQPISGMDVGVKDGFAWFDNAWIKNDSLLVLTVPDADMSLSRYDMICIEVNQTESVRNGLIKYITGIPSNVPMKPEASTDEGVYQHPIAYIKVNPGVTEITESDIQIVVGLTNCPFATGILATADITDMFNQWEGDFESWFETVKGQLSGDVAGNIQNQLDAVVESVEGKASKDDVESAAETVLDISSGKLMRMVGDSSIHPAIISSNLKIDISFKSWISTSDSIAKYYTRDNYYYKIYTTGTIARDDNSAIKNTTMEEIRNLKIYVKKYDSLTNKQIDSRILYLFDNMYERMLSNIQTFNYSDATNSTKLKGSLKCKLSNCYKIHSQEYDSLVLIRIEVNSTSTSLDISGSSYLAINLSTFEKVFFTGSIYSSITNDQNMYFGSGIFTRSCLISGSSNYTYTFRIYKLNKQIDDEYYLDMSNSSYIDQINIQINCNQETDLISFYKKYVIIAPYMYSTYTSKGKNINIYKIDVETGDTQIVVLSSDNTYSQAYTLFIENNLMYFIIFSKAGSTSTVLKTIIKAINLDNFSIVDDINYELGTSEIKPYYLFSIGRTHYFYYTDNIMFFNSENGELNILSQNIGTAYTNLREYIASSNIFEKERILTMRNWESLGTLIAIPTSSKIINIMTNEIYNTGEAYKEAHLSTSSPYVVYTMESSVTGYTWLDVDERVEPGLMEKSGSIGVYSFITNRSPILFMEGSVL